MKLCLLALLTTGWLAAVPARAQIPAASVGPARSQTLPAGPAAARPRTASNGPTARPPAPDGDAAAARPLAPEAGSGGAGAYLLAPQDVVEVRVFQEEDLLTTARIAQDGTIKFPLIGSVRIVGKTEDSAAQVIAAGLARDYIVNPQVTVKIVEYAQQRYTVLGQVGKPGTYIIPDRATITLFEAIGNAGGFTRIANLSDIKLKRLVDGKDTLYKLSAKGTENDRRSSTFEIKAGDIITVGESFF